MFYMQNTDPILFESHCLRAIPYQVITWEVAFAETFSCTAVCVLRSIYSSANAIYHYYFSEKHMLHVSQLNIRLS